MYLRPLCPWLLVGHQPPPDDGPVRVTREEAGAGRVGAQGDHVRVRVVQGGGLQARRSNCETVPRVQWHYDFEKVICNVTNSFFGVMSKALTTTTAKTALPSTLRPPSHLVALERCQPDLSIGQPHHGPGRRRRPAETGHSTGLDELVADRLLLAAPLLAELVHEHDVVRLSDLESKSCRCDAGLFYFGT